MTAMSKADFKVGDKVRVADSYFHYPRRGQVGVVTRSDVGYITAQSDQWVKNNSVLSDGKLVFFPGELELVEPPFLDKSKASSETEAPLQFTVGDRVELAGVQGTVTFVYRSSRAVDVKWSETEVSVLNGPLLKQLKKIEPEQVFVTGAWYKYKSFSDTLYYLSTSGFTGLYVSFDGELKLVRNCCADAADWAGLVEIDSPL